MSRLTDLRKLRKDTIERMANASSDVAFAQLGKLLAATLKQIEEAERATPIASPLAELEARRQARGVVIPPRRPGVRRAPVA